MRILKMLLRLIALPALIASLVVHVLLALVIGLSSIVTNLDRYLFHFRIDRRFPCFSPFLRKGCVAHPRCPVDGLADGRLRHFLFPRSSHCRLDE